MFQTGKKPQPQPYKIEGIGQDEMPGNVDFSVIDEIHAVADKDAFLRTRLLARKEGIFAGGSAGAALHVALKVAAGLSETDVVVVIIPDSGTRYLSKIYNDNWMKENQFLEPAIQVRAAQVVRDKARRTKELVFVPLGITVEDAVNLMREHDISQMPVIESGEVVGSLNESRILDILVSDAGARRKPVVEYMDKPFPVVSEEASLTELAQRMHREISAVLVKQPGGYDIITKSDLIFFLTRKDGGKG
jgi:predicted transcriptional regulator